MRSLQSANKTWASPGFSPRRILIDVAPRGAGYLNRGVAVALAWLRETCRFAGVFCLCSVLPRLAGRWGRLPSTLNSLHGTIRQAGCSAMRTIGLRREDRPTPA